MVEVNRIGDLRRAFDGTLIREMRGTKRRWSFQTKPITELRALSLVGLLQGQGLYLPFDADLYAENGFGYTGSIAQIAGAAADTSPAFDQNGVALARSTGSVMGVSSGAVNLLTNAAQTNPSSTANWFGASATLSLDTANFFTGTQSLKVVTSAVSIAGATATPSPAGSLNTTYTFSAYVKGTGTYRIFFQDTANGTQVSGPIVTGSATAWTRISATLTTVAAGSTPTLNGRCAVADSLAKTFYVGGAQLETSAFPTPYTPVGTSRTATNIAYPYNPLGPSGMTLNWWQTPPQAGANRYIFSAWDGFGGNQVAVYEPSSTVINARVKNAAADDTIQAFGLAYGTAWNMMTLVLRTHPETGEANFAFYQNGILRGSGSTSAIPVGMLTSFYVGSGFGINGTGSLARIDDMQVLPYPVDSTTVTGWYGATSMGATPHLSATGDVMQDNSVEVVGLVNRIDVVAFQGTTGWRQTGRVVSFTLEEV